MHTGDTWFELEKSRRFAPVLRKRTGGAMSMGRDRDLGMHRDITRRDFVNGVGVAIGGSLIAPGWLAAQEHAPDVSGMQEWI